MPQQEDQPQQHSTAPVTSVFLAQLLLMHCQQEGDDVEGERQQEEEEDAANRIET